MLWSPVCVSCHCVLHEKYRVASVAAFHFFVVVVVVFVQLELVKKTLHEANKTPKEYLGSLSITHTIRFLLLILISKGFLDVFFSC